MFSSRLCCELSTPLEAGLRASYKPLETISSHTIASPASPSRGVHFRTTLQVQNQRAAPNEVQGHGPLQRNPRGDSLPK